MFAMGQITAESSHPTVLGELRLKSTVRYLKTFPRLIWVDKYQEAPAEVKNILVDSDCAADKVRAKAPREVC